MYVNHQNIIYKEKEPSPYAITISSPQNMSVSISLSPKLSAPYTFGF